MDYAGYYINLERSSERRLLMEAELKHYGLAEAYQRFNAADGNTLGISAPNLSPGIIGCWISHYLLLKENLGRDKHLHVIEDDTVFASCTGRVLDWAVQTGFLDRCDILYTDVSVPLLNDAYKTYKSHYDKAVTLDDKGEIVSVKFEVLNLSGMTFAGTSSFLINKNSIRKLHDLYETELQRGLATPIDLFIRHQAQQRNIKVGCIFPFVTTPRFENVLFSDIDPDSAERKRKFASALGRYMFFVGRDWKLCSDYMDKCVPFTEDRMTSVLGRLLTFSITDNYTFP